MTQQGDDDIVLDFFAGSGTTGHAVMQQNVEDGGNRKSILVQLPEPMEKKVLDGIELNTIADICRERVRRAGRKIAAEHQDKGLDTGFRSYKPAPSTSPHGMDRVDASGLMTSTAGVVHAGNTAAIAGCND
ncbi:MAG: site-specific DNA-methyltransferase [Thermomicrobiales bacterium]|nr:site-specific DNA-methyltransferase [Thermomicrobiales bacterium]